MANAKKCSGINCPFQFQRVTSDDCKFYDCPYRTEAIDPQEVLSGIGNYIADLVVQKLKAEHLEQEPCEDCISRQAALDTFGLSEKSRKYGGDHSGYDTIMLYEVQDALEALLAVQPQPKTVQIDMEQRNGGTAPIKEGMNEKQVI